MGVVLDILQTVKASVDRLIINFMKVIVGRIIVALLENVL